MPIATISSKRQITLPVRVLDNLGIRPNDRVLVSEANGEIRIKRVPDILELAGKIKGRGLSLAQEKELMMEAASERALGRRK